MEWTVTTDVEAYAAAAGALLAEDPERHSVGLTVVADAREREVPLDPPERYGWWTDADGWVAGAFSQTPPFPLLLEVAPDDAVRPLVDTLAASDRPVPGVNAPAGLAAAFAAAWLAHPPGGEPTMDAVLHHAMRLFRLERLTPPIAPPPGAARQATESDLPLLVEWQLAFAAEARTLVHAGSLPGLVLARVRDGRDWLWCDRDGHPVSLAGRSRQVSGVTRVGPVYTPPEHRGRGYGAAVTAQVSAAALGSGQRVVLFTDLANPTSNALYQRLGYRAVDDWTWLRFEPRRCPEPGRSAQPPAG